MPKRVMLLAAVMVWCLLPVMDRQGGTAYAAADVWGGNVATGFTGGDGSSESPYEIAAGAQLAYLAERVNADDALYNYSIYLLTSDIEAAQYSDS